MREDALYVTKMTGAHKGGLMTIAIHFYVEQQFLRHKFASHFALFLLLWKNLFFHVCCRIVFLLSFLYKLLIRTFEDGRGFLAQPFQLQTNPPYVGISLL